MCRAGTPWKGDGDHIPDDSDVAGVAYVPCRHAFAWPSTYPAAPCGVSANSHLSPFVSDKGRIVVKGP